MNRPIQIYITIRCIVEDVLLRKKQPQQVPRHVASHAPFKRRAPRLAQSKDGISNSDDKKTAGGTPQGESDVSSRETGCQKRKKLVRVKKEKFFIVVK